MSIVVPFYGTTGDGEELLEAVGVVRLREGDEVVVADNTEDGRMAPAPPDGAVRVVAAPLERSSYYARNVGVEATTNDWLLFLDSDCRPSADVIDAYFVPPPDERTGIVSGSVHAAEGQQELVARYAASRGHIDPEAYAPREDRRPAGITANLLVRRAAWADVNGFHEGIKSGADLEFCWRVQDAGWGFDWRPDAKVAHEHVTTLKTLRKKTVRHAGGGGWVNQHHPGAFNRPPLAKHLARCAAGVVVWTVALQPRRALYKGIDALFLSFDAYGRLTGNRAGRDPAPPSHDTTVLVAETWPNARDAGAVEQVVALGGDVRVEALRRSALPDRAARRAVRVTYAEDDGALRRIGDAAALALRHPLRTARALRGGASLHDVVRVAPVVRRLEAFPARVRPLGEPDPAVIALLPRSARWPSPA